MTREKILKNWVINYIIRLSYVKKNREISI
jgi:hypothetical protein